MRYAAFLRGVNVGGHRPLKMADLRAAFEGMGLQQVRTVLASGNVVFEATDEGDESALAARIERQLARLFGHAIRVVVRRLEDLQRLVASAPFAGVTVTPETRLYVTFLAQPAENRTGFNRVSIGDGGAGGLGTGIMVVMATPGEVLTALTLAPGRGTPELMSLLEGELGSGVTTRSWDTVAKVAAV